jgi:hypothetical protein
MRRTLLGSAAFALGVAALAAGVAGATGGGPPEFTPVEVHGKAVGNGLRLTVHVFPAAPERRDGRPAPVAPSCTDGDQSAHAHFAQAKQGGMVFRLDNTFAPSAVRSGAPAAITAGFEAWDAVIAGDYFDVQRDDAAADRPIRDGVNAAGWARLNPKGTLAATYSWTDQAGRVVESDMFFNTRHTWGVLSGCNASSAFDIQNVGTHEAGHVLGLDHVSDANRMATMYPSAPGGEVKKRTLTAGDAAGAAAALQ